MSWTVYIQWSEDPMREYVAFDAADWPSLHGTLFNAGFVQGIGLGDDYAWVKVLPDDRLEVRKWSDNGHRDGQQAWGEIWLLSHELIDVSYAVPGGTIREWGPKQRHTYYVPPGHLDDYQNEYCGGVKVECKLFGDFPMPPANEILHGTLVSDALWESSLEFTPPDWVA